MNQSNNMKNVMGGGTGQMNNMNMNNMGMNQNMMNPAMMKMNMGMNQGMMNPAMMNMNNMGMNPMMNMNNMGMNPMMNMQNMNNAIENMNKGLEDTNGWKITFIKDGKEETMKFSKDIIVNEALNKYKIKIGEAGNLKLKFAENKKQFLFFFFLFRFN